MTSYKHEMPSVLDREVRHPDADAFGHKDFARALKSLIEADQNEPPYSIGLLGPWGTGKSTIKRLYGYGLNDDAGTHRQDSRRSRIRQITFNAWRYGGDNIKRALLRHVYLELGGKDQDIADALCNQIKRDFLETRTIQDILHELYEKLIWNIIPIGVIILMFIGALWASSEVLGLSSDWAKASTALVVAILSGIVTKLVTEPGRFSIPRYSRATRVELPRSSAEDYEELLVSQIEQFKVGPGKKCERLVIFVDDLDRLSADEMVNGLDAIRTFMEIPVAKLPNDIGVVFVISCDEARVAAALADRRWQRMSSELPGAVLTLSDARRYLDRIFQFRLEIPPFPKQDMRQFVITRMTEDCSNIVEEVESKGVRLDEIVDRMIHTGVSSPRNALQILNAFVQSWWLAKGREFEGAGTDRFGGLSEGVVTTHPLTLAAICALRVDFPDFYRHLEYEPDLLERATDVFVRKVKLNEQPETTQHILRPYFSDVESLTLKEEHRPLRRFLASLQGLEWPQTLQPFLLLTQDPITRSYGDGSIRIYMNLVSGDSHGVLEELGRDKDTKVLSFRETRLIRDFMDSVAHETEAKKDNAAIVLADLAPRLTEENAGLLMTPLCDQLGRSNTLRSRVGIERIKTVVPKVRAATQRHLVGILTEDLLPMKGDIRLALHSLQTPSLKEAVNMVRSGLDLIFNVREKHGLDYSTEDSLLSWLRVRRVSINEKEQLFPFSDLERWVSKREKGLLPYLREDYTDQLIAELEAGRHEDLELESALRRAKTVLENIWTAGTEDRQIFWDQTSRLVGVRSEEGVEAAILLARPYLNEAEQPNVTNFILKFIDRLKKEVEAQTDWQLERERVAAQLVQLLNENSGKVGDKCFGPLRELTSAYGAQEEQTELFEQVCAAACRIDSTTVHGSIEDLIPQISQDLPKPTVEWIGTHFSDFLNEDERVNVISQFSRIVSQDNIPDSMSERYEWFVNSLDLESKIDERMRKHATDVFAQLPGRHNDPNKFLTKVFPTAVSFLEGDWPPKSGQYLQNLLNNANGNPKIYSFLHSQLRGCEKGLAVNFNIPSPSRL